MFERRLKVVLLILFALTGVLLARAAHLQVLNGAEWADRAEKAMLRPQWVETVRGRLLDLKGRPVAEDVASTDTMVDYRAVLRPPDPKWVANKAVERLRLRMGDGYRKASLSDRRSLRDDEVQFVLADIDRMWLRLADVSRLPSESREQSVARIDEVRQSIIQRVEMRRRYLWYHNYSNAIKEQEEQQKLREHQSIWEKWLLDASAAPPDVDKFIMTVAEQEQPHVVLRAIDPHIVAELARDAESLPGLSLSPSTNRYYPFHDVGAHLVGRLARVNEEDIKTDPNRRGTGGDELRQYFPNDLIGRTGLEQLCEPLLRGTRGRIERRIGAEDEITANAHPEPGKDVRLAIDMDLQADAQRLFKHVNVELLAGETDLPELYGAAIVIDVPTGEVRAMASNPSFDPNEFNEKFADWYDDAINRPLLNRATLMAAEPGSTVKPVVGLSAITEGVIGVHEGIECTGYLTLGKWSYQSGRCWTANMYGEKYPHLVAHHQLPGGSARHVGQYGNRDGFLTYSDSLERSCNIWFEVAAHRLGPAKMRDWMQRWGLGRPTGLGIPEAFTWLPNDTLPRKVEPKTAHLLAAFTGIGQGQITATPIQMANVAATIARDGIWKRPRLISSANAFAGLPKLEGPDEVDLKLSPEGLAEAKLGMMRVVNRLSGTGHDAFKKHPELLTKLKVAGKTGSAQAGREFNITENDPITRKPKRDEKGRVVRQYFKPMTKTTNNGMPWYRGGGEKNDKLSHAWYIGFAPYDNPKVAFCVFVEYGGSGGLSAGDIARRLLVACQDRGYLPGGAIDAAVGMR